MAHMRYGFKLFIYCADGSPFSPDDERKIEHRFDRLEPRKKHNTTIKMSGKSYTTGASTKRTTDLKAPVKSDGTKDKRYTTVQFVKNDGTRDKRTTLTGNR